MRLNPTAVDALAYELRLNTSQLARKAGISRQYCGRLRRGERTASLSTIRSIAGALGTTVKEITLEGEPPVSPLMKATEAAPLVGMKPRTLLDKAKRGEIDCHRDGRLVTFAEEHLAAYRAKHHVVAQQPEPLPARNPRYAR